MKIYKSLYHILDYDSLVYALKCNCLRGNHYAGQVSLTKSKDLNYYIGARSGSFIKLELDGVLLAKDYDLKNFTFVSHTAIRFSGEKEVLIQGELKNLSKYLKRIILIKSEIESLKNTNWFTIKGVRNGVGQRSLPSIVNSIYKKFKNILYVQDDSEIKKDNIYIKNLINYSLKSVFDGYAIYYRGFERKYSDNWHGIINKEICLPNDIANPIINQLVIGYDYENLKLYKNLDDLNKNIKLKKNFKIYYFKFEYESKDIKKDFKKFCLITSARLIDIDLL